MTSSLAIEELLVEYSDPLTEAEFSSRCDQLLIKFREQHNLSTWDEIKEAIRTHAIDESLLTEEWIELRAFESAGAARG